MCRGHHTLGAHRLLFYLLLFQERPLCQDPTTLALNLWNSMVSGRGWGSR